MLTCCPMLLQHVACHQWYWWFMWETAFVFLFVVSQLFDLVYREETLLNVIKSVTRNGRSIILTAVLALILVYLFSIVGYLFFKDDFILEVDKLPNETLLPGWYRRLVSTICVEESNGLLFPGACWASSTFCKTYRLPHQFDNFFLTKDTV